MKKQVWLLALLCFLIAVPGALAQGLLDGVWQKVVRIGNLSFLGVSDGSVVVAFTRLLIGFLLFTVFFGVITNLGQLKFLNRGQAGVVAGIVAIIGAVFMPANVILAVGAGWATAVSLILIGGPLVGFGYMLFNLTKWLGKEKDTKSTVFLKFVICLLLFWILSAMKYHVGRLA